MNTIPVTVQLLSTCTSDHFQGFSGPTIAIAVDARTTAGDVQTALLKADEWPENLLDGELWEPIRQCIGDTALRRNTNLFPDIGPDEAPADRWVSPLPNDLGGWVVVDKEDGTIGGPFPSEKVAICECWDGSDEIEPVYAYFGISLETPDGYLVQMHSGHWHWGIAGPAGRAHDECYDTEMEAKVAAWRDHLSQKPDDVRLTADGYHALHDGLSDMIESGRLTEADIPDDYHWLVESLADLGGRNTSDPVRMANAAAKQVVLAYAKASRAESVEWEDIGIAYEYALAGVSAEFLAEVREEYPEAGL